jgi:hypothetical protein
MALIKLTIALIVISLIVIALIVISLIIIALIVILIIIALIVISLIIGALIYSGTYNILKTTYSELSIIFLYLIGIGFFIHFSNGSTDFNLSSDSNSLVY